MTFFEVFKIFQRSDSMFSSAAISKASSTRLDLPCPTHLEAIQVWSFSQMKIESKIEMVHPGPPGLHRGHQPPPGLGLWPDLTIAQFDRCCSKASAWSKFGWNLYCHALSSFCLKIAIHNFLGQISQTSYSKVQMWGWWDWRAVQQTGEEGGGERLVGVEVELRLQQQQRQQPNLLRHRPPPLASTQRLAIASADFDCWLHSI